MESRNEGRQYQERFSEREAIDHVLADIGSVAHRRLVGGLGMPEEIGDDIFRALAVLRQAVEEIRREAWKRS